MTNLITTPNLSQPDDFYAALLATHKDLPEAESHALNAQLILILANHIGDQTVLTQALDLAKAG